MSAASSAAAMIRLVLSIWSATGPDANAPTVGSHRSSPRPGRSAKDVGEQFGRGRAGDLGRGRRSGRRPDDQIGLGHIQPGLKQAGDDADQPRIACRSATTKDQRGTGGVLRDVARPRRGVVLKRMIHCRSFLRVRAALPRQLRQSRDRELKGAPGVDTACIGLTSSNRVTFAQNLPLRRTPPSRHPVVSRHREEVGPTVDGSPNRGCGSRCAVC